MPFRMGDLFRGGASTNPQQNIDEMQGSSRMADLFRPTRSEPSELPRIGSLFGQRDGMVSPDALQAQSPELSGQGQAALPTSLMQLGQPQQEAVLGPQVDVDTTGMTPEQLRTYELKRAGVGVDWRQGPVGYFASSAQAMGYSAVKGMVDLGQELGILRGDVWDEMQKELDKPIVEHQMQQRVNIERAMENGGVVGRAATIVGQTAADTLLFLALMKFGMKPFGGISLLPKGIKAGSTASAAKQALMLSNAGEAMKLATYRFITAPGDLEEKAKAAGISFAYRATPALSGLSGTLMKAKFYDFLLNSGVSVGTKQYEEAWEHGKIEAANAGDKNWLAYSLTNLIPIVGTDAFFSLMTRNLSTEMARAEGRGGVDAQGKPLEPIQDFGKRGIFRDITGTQAANIAAKFFEARAEKNQPVPQGWDKMTEPQMIEAYAKFMRQTVPAEKQAEAKAAQDQQAAVKAEEDAKEASRQAVVDEAAAAIRGGSPTAEAVKAMNDAGVEGEAKNPYQFAKRFLNMDNEEAKAFAEEHRTAKNNAIRAAKAGEVDAARAEWGDAVKSVKADGTTVFDRAILIAEAKALGVPIKGKTADLAVAVREARNDLAARTTAEAEMQPMGQAARPVEAAAVPVREEIAPQPAIQPESARSVTEAKPPELMTPEEAVAAKDRRDETHVRLFIDARDDAEFFGKDSEKAQASAKALKDFEDNAVTWEGVGGSERAKTIHEGRIAFAISKSKPVSAAAVDAYGIKLPPGYVREGDRYVFKGETPARAVETAVVSEKPAISETGKLAETGKPTAVDKREQRVVMATTATEWAKDSDAQGVFKEGMTRDEAFATLPKGVNKAAAQQALKAEGWSLTRRAKGDKRGGEVLRRVPISVEKAADMGAREEAAGRTIGVETLTPADIVAEAEERGEPAVQTVPDTAKRVADTAGLDPRQAEIDTYKESRKEMLNEIRPLEAKKARSVSEAKRLREMKAAVAELDKLISAGESKPVTHVTPTEVSKPPMGEKPPELMTPEEFISEQWNRIGGKSQFDADEIASQEGQWKQQWYRTMLDLPRDASPSFDAMKAMSEGDRNNLISVNENAARTWEQNVGWATTKYRDLLGTVKTRLQGEMASRHRASIQRAIDQKAPITSDAVDVHNLQLPEGYTLEGDRYVFKGEATTPLSGTVSKPPMGEKAVPASADLNDWVLKNYPKEYEASRYLNPSSQYGFHKKIWEKAGSPDIDFEAAPTTPLSGTVSSEPVTGKEAVAQEKVLGFLELPSTIRVPKADGKGTFALKKAEKYMVYDLGEGKLLLKDGKQVTVFEGDLPKSVRDRITVQPNIAAGGLTPQQIAAREAKATEEAAKKAASLPERPSEMSGKQRMEFNKWRSLHPLDSERGWSESYDLYKKSLAFENGESGPYRNEEMQNKIISSARKLLTQAIDLERGQPVRGTISKIRRGVSRFFGEFVKDAFMLERLGPEVGKAYSEAREQFGTKADNAWSEAVKFIRKGENVEPIRKAVQAPDYKMRATLGGSLKDGVGGREQEMRLTAGEQLTIAMHWMAAKQGGEEAAKVKDAIHKVVLGEGAKGQENRVFHLSDAELDRLVTSLNPDQRKALEVLRQAYDMMFPYVAETYKSITGKDLPKREYYSHITRDMSFTTDKMTEAERKTAENEFTLFNRFPLTYQIDPNKKGFVQKLGYADQPIMVRDAFDEVERHMADVAYYISASNMRQWVSDNFLSRQAMGVRQSLQGSDEGEMILSHMKDLHDKIGGFVNVGTDTLDRAIGAFIRNATITRLASPWVWLKQPMSMPSAATYFGLEHLGAAFNRDKAFINSVTQASPYLFRRYSERQYDRFLADVPFEGRSAGLTERWTPRSRIQDFVGSRMKQFDKTAIDGIIMMAKSYVEKNSPNLKGDAFIAEVARQANIAVQRTQVATDMLDRSMAERNIVNPVKKMMIYMYGARGAQFNLLANAFVMARKERSPDAYRLLANTLISAGMMQATGIALVDLLKTEYKGVLKEKEEEELAAKATDFGMAIFENLASTIPVIGTEFLPAIMAPIYQRIGLKDKARLRTYRIGMTGPLSTTVRDLHTILSSAGRIQEASSGLGQAKNSAQRRAANYKMNTNIDRAVRASLRLGSEAFGVPVNQMIDLFPTKDWEK
jgi:hypothetical protein